MANYLYKTVLYQDTSSVAGADPDNDTNMEDYEDNNQSSTLRIDSLEISETTFVIDVSYADFDGYIVTPYDWGDVKEVSLDNRYDLYLITSSAF